jgi:hypothetical protein
MDLIAFLLLVCVVPVPIWLAVRIYTRDRARGFLLEPPPVPVRVHVVGAAKPGAYRGGGRLIEVVEHGAVAPRTPRLLALVCMFIAITAIPSAFVVLFGCLVGDPFAWTFGLAGMPLAIVHWGVGRRLQHGYALNADRGKRIAVWSMVHNGLLFACAAVILIAFASGFRRRYMPWSLGTIAMTPSIAATAAVCAAGMLVIAAVLWRSLNREQAYASASEASEDALALRVRIAETEPHAAIAALTARDAAASLNQHVELAEVDAEPARYSSAIKR